MINFEDILKSDANVFTDRFLELLRFGFIFRAKSLDFSLVEDSLSAFIRGDVIGFPYEFLTREEAASAFLTEGGASLIGDSLSDDSQLLFLSCYNFMLCSFCKEVFRNNRFSYYEFCISSFYSLLKRWERVCVNTVPYNKYQAGQSTIEAATSSKPSPLAKGIGALNRIPSVVLFDNLEDSLKYGILDTLCTHFSEVALASSIILIYVINLFTKGLSLSRFSFEAFIAFLKETISSSLPYLLDTPDVRFIIDRLGGFASPDICNEINRILSIRLSPDISDFWMCDECLIYSLGLLFLSPKERLQSSVCIDGDSDSIAALTSFLAILARV